MYPLILPNLSHLSKLSSFGFFWLECFKRFKKMIVSFQIFMQYWFYYYYLIVHKKVVVKHHSYYIKWSVCLILKKLKNLFSALLACLLYIPHKYPFQRKILGNLFCIFSKSLSHCHDRYRQELQYYTKITLR